MKKILTTSALLIMGLILLGFALLQLNDPDPIIWATFYSICALVPLTQLFGRYYRSIAAVALVLSLIQLFIAAPGAFEYWHHINQEALMQSMNPEKPYIEEARELLGVAIALILVCISHFLSAYTMPSNKVSS
jgi:hypothetical protein